MTFHQKRERAIPDNVPSGSITPVIVSKEFIVALRQAGVSDSVLTALEKDSEEAAKGSA